MGHKKRLSAIFFVFAFPALFVSLFAQEKAKIKVAVLPPSASGDASASVSQGLTSVIVTELSRSPSLEVSDRRDVDKALKEQAFGQAGYCEQSCQIEIGKILQSKWVVTGDLNKIGTLYILTLKILNVETSKIEYQDEEEYKGEVEGLVPKTKALTSRLASFLVTGKKAVKPVEKEETLFVPKETTKQTKNVPQKEGMVLIPAGEFWMGSDEKEAKDAWNLCKTYWKDCPWDWFKAEMPKHKVYLDTFYMDIYEVTNAQFKKCVKVGKCKKPYDTKWYNDSKSASANHPVMSVDWTTADAFCKWLGKRLPTEAEWEKSARGEQGYVYPWGNEFDCSKSCNSISPCKQISTCAVGSFSEDVSPYGIYDMAGNVWEWVSDWYDENYYKNSPYKNPKGPSDGQYHGLRGGSWGGDDPDFIRGSVRRPGLPGRLGLLFRGIRCAADAK